MGSGIPQKDSAQAASRGEGCRSQLQYRPPYHPYGIASSRRRVSVHGMPMASPLRTDGPSRNASSSSRAGARAASARRRPALALRVPSAEKHSDHERAEKRRSLKMKWFSRGPPKQLVSRDHHLVSTEIQACACRSVREEDRREAGRSPQTLWSFPLSSPWPPPRRLLTC